jgi:hypothetical protein
MPVRRAVEQAADSLAALNRTMDTEPSLLQVALQPLYHLVWFVINWIAAPLLLLGMLAYGVEILRQTRSREQRTSARAGLWCGVIAALIFIATQSSQFVPPTVIVEPDVNMNVAFAGIGAVVGFVFLYAIKWLAPTRLVGLLITIIASTSLVSLYAYFFIAPLRQIVFPGALGLAFGALMHQVVFPGALLANLRSQGETGA